MTDENESGPPEDESYAQYARAHDRRIARNQYKDKLDQGVEIRKVLEKAHSDQDGEAQTAPSPQAPSPIVAVLELLSGRNAVDLADLSEAAAARHAEPKSALTPARETALRDLETGKGSTLVTARILRSAPQLLDVLPDIPLVQKVRELVGLLNAPQEWDGFLDPYWTIAQTVLWIVTRDPWIVDQASNRSGRLGETWGQVRAADLIETLILPREHVEDGADKLWERCLDGRMEAINGQNRPIPAIEWRHLKIVLNDGNMLDVVRRGQSSCEPAYRDVVFSRAGVLREIPRDKSAEDQDVTARRQEPSSAAPPEIEMICNALPQRNANWEAPAKLPIVGWSPTASSAASAPAAPSAAPPDASQIYGDDGAAAQSGASTDGPAIGTAKAEAINPEKEPGSDPEQQGTDRVPRRQRLPKRPLSKTGRTTIVTAAWDVIGLHPEWGTHGIPPHWSKEKAGIEVNKHLRTRIRQGKIDPNAYPIRPNSKGEWEISADSIGRALVQRRPHRT
jgi:hypothetical protein